MIGLMFGGIIGVVCAIGGTIMLILCAFMLVIYPWQLLWFAPVTYLLCRYAYRKLFKRRPHLTLSDPSSLFPPGYVVPLSEPRHDDEPHYVEPFTQGGHTRNRHVH